MENDVVCGGQHFRAVFVRAACDGRDFPQIHHLLAQGCDLGRDRRAAGSARKYAGERR